MNKSQHTQAELQAMLWEYLASDRVVPRRLEGWKRVGRVLQRNGEELLNYLDQLAVNDISADAEKTCKRKLSDSSLISRAGRRPALTTHEGRSKKNRELFECSTHSSSSRSVK
jgi:hypothetical protein